MTIGPENATDKTVSWNCDSPYISLDISKDTLSAKIKIADGAQAETATVTATANSDKTKRATCTVTIKEASQVTPPAPSIASLNGTYIFGDTTLTLQDGKVFDVDGAEVGTVQIREDGKAIIDISDGTSYFAERTPDGKINTNCQVEKIKDFYVDYIPVVNITNGNTGGNQGGSGETTCAHEWGEGSVTKEPTETEDGLRTYKCAKCGVTKTKAIPALNHSHTIVSEWMSDYTYHWHEASCGIESHYADKSEHTTQTRVAKEATCAEAGMLETYCTVCEKVTASEAIAKIPHTWNDGIVTTPATEAYEGVRTFTCTVCYQTKTEQIPALGHEHEFESEWTSDDTYHWHAASCRNPDHYSEKSEHTWDEGKVTKEPTCTETGVMTYTCTVCKNATKAESIEATGHSTVAVLTDDGEREEKCSVCQVTTTPKAPWTSANISKLSDALKSYAGTNAKVKVAGYIQSDVFTSSMKYIIKALRENESKQVALDLSEANHYYKLGKDTDSSFAGCTNLVSMTIPNGVSQIDSYTFEGCTGLESITIPKDVKVIQWRTFRGCNNLKNIVVDAKNTAYCAENGIIYTKDKKTLYAYPSASGNVSIPEGVTIEKYAFYDCTNLKSVDIPSSVTKIEEETFYGCTNLTSVNILDGVTAIKQYAFFGCTSLASVTIPGSVTTINDYTFSDCTNLTSVNIPDSVTKIGSYAFSGCSSLANVTIPSSVTKIGSSAFDSCSSLKSVTIPGSVTTIGQYTFKNCTNLTSLTILDGVTTIDAKAFLGCENLANVTIPGSVTTIGQYAFMDSKGPMNVEILDGMKTIPTSAFEGCRGLTSVTIPNSVTAIERYAFRDTSLAKVTIPSSVTKIWELAFKDCKSLESVDISDSVTEIGSAMFSGCTSLKSVTIPGSVTTIGSIAFSSCSSLTSVTIPNSVTTIGSSAFEYCTKLETITYTGTKDSWIYRAQKASIRSGVKVECADGIYTTP